MPFQPGVLFSALLMILCLGINIVSYPEVRQMFKDQDNGNETAEESVRTDTPEIEVKADNRQKATDAPANIQQTEVRLTETVIPPPVADVVEVAKELVFQPPVLTEEQSRKTGSAAAFLPVIPPEMEKDYWKPQPNGWMQHSNIIFHR